MPNIVRLMIRGLFIGFVLAVVFEIAFMFVPLPDAVLEKLLYVAPGVLWQLTRWSDHRTTETSLFLTNALVYAVIAVLILVVRHRRDLTPRS